MTNVVDGVVSHSKGDQVKLQSIIVPDPSDGEVLVKVKACGVCHTDLHYREGSINNDYPFLLGHEAAGIVQKVGEGVTNVNEGDFVIIAWRSPCGRCRSCVKGKPWYCFDSQNATQKMTLKDGTELTPALGIGAFSELTLVDAGQAIKVNPSVKPETAGLMGCGIMAGLGASINTAGISQGDSVAVFGCGGVGNAAIAGAKLAGAQTIIGIDIADNKLGWASDFGATHTINALENEPVQLIRNITGGHGVDVSIDAVGTESTYSQAFYARDHAGILVLVGVPNTEMTLDLPLIEVFGRGGALKSSWYGDCLPSRDFPTYINHHLNGTLDLDKFVTETITLSEIEDAFKKMQDGQVLRSVVMFN